uniref:Uncharacterized protein n=2 Tax=Corethron hystrix TaxID=216773 RepID=A0A7S1BZV0_9STRA
MSGGDAMSRKSLATKGEKKSTSQQTQQHRAGGRLLHGHQHRRQRSRSDSGGGGYSLNHWVGGGGSSRTTTSVEATGGGGEESFKTGEMMTTPAASSGTEKTSIVGKAPATIAVNFRGAGVSAEVISSEGGGVAAGVTGGSMLDFGRKDGSGMTISMSGEVKPVDIDPEKKYHAYPSVVTAAAMFGGGGGDATGTVGDSSGGLGERTKTVRGNGNIMECSETVDREKQHRGMMPPVPLLLAAAASNGVIVIWDSCNLVMEDVTTGGALQGKSAMTSAATSSPSANFTTSAASPSDASSPAGGGPPPVHPVHFGRPEAVLAEHQRAVNRLAWSPFCPTMLLSASQDGTIKLWDRKMEHITRLLEDDSRDTGTQLPHNQQQQQQQHQQHQQQQQQQQPQKKRWFSSSNPVQQLTQHSSTPPKQSAASSLSSLFQQHPTPPKVHRKSSGTGIKSSTIGPTSFPAPSSSSSFSDHHHHRSSSWNATNATTHYPIWSCINTFSPMIRGSNEPIRDVKWNPHIRNLFAAVTNGGDLIVYDVNLSAKPLIKLSVHSGEATSCDWHPDPRRAHVIATGGGRDCCVKVWDLEEGLQAIHSASTDMHPDYNKSSGSNRSDPSTERSPPNSSLLGVSRSWADESTIATRGNTLAPQMYATVGPGYLSHRPGGKTLSFTTIHVLSIAAPVTRIAWRPPCDFFENHTGATTTPVNHHSSPLTNQHDAMLAVGTAPTGGASTGSGSIGLWSCHRPFLPLSVVEGHEGAVTAFEWSDLAAQPLPSSSKPKTEAVVVSKKEKMTADRQFLGFMKYHPTTQSSSSFSDLPAPSPVVRSLFPKGEQHNDNDSILSRNATERRVKTTTTATADHSSVAKRSSWRCVVSVGRDGNCLLQDFANGLRPIEEVPHSAFGIALVSHGRGRRRPCSPKQSGNDDDDNEEHENCCSMQIMSVDQRVPSFRKGDFVLWEDPVPTTEGGHATGMNGATLTQPLTTTLSHPVVGGARLPRESVKVLHTLVDRDVLSATPPSGGREGRAKSRILAPELLHLAYFSQRYLLHRDRSCPSLAAVCRYNADVARKKEGYMNLSRMWEMLGIILEGHDDDVTSSLATHDANLGVMSFLMWPSITSLLQERSEAGDVQTCVAICEVMNIFDLLNNQDGSSDQAAAISLAMDSFDIDITMVREWYLSYLEILQRMCLFVEATSLISSCKDPVISALNKQSTTIHESCSTCGKPLLMQEAAVTTNATSLGMYDASMPCRDAPKSASHGDQDRILRTQRTCASCRQKVGKFFLHFGAYHSF